MLQVVHADVAKVDRDDAFIAIVLHVRCKLLFLMFHLFFRRLLQVCLSRCCICFRTYIASFYLDVAYVCNCVFQVFSGVFANVSDASFK